MTKSIFPNIGQGLLIPVLLAAVVFLFWDIKLIFSFSTVTGVLQCGSILVVSILGLITFRSLRAAKQDQAWQRTYDAVLLGALVLILAFDISGYFLISSTESSFDTSIIKYKFEWPTIILIFVGGIARFIILGHTKKAPRITYPHVILGLSTLTAFAFFTVLVKRLVLNILFILFSIAVGQKTYVAIVLAIMFLGIAYLTLRALNAARQQRFWVRWYLWTLTLAIVAVFLIVLINGNITPARDPYNFIAYIAVSVLYGLAAVVYWQQGNRNRQTSPDAGNETNLEAEPDFGKQRME